MIEPFAYQDGEGGKKDRHAIAGRPAQGALRLREQAIDFTCLPFHDVERSLARKRRAEGAHGRFDAHAQGVVEFVPAAGATYSVHGSVAPEASSVWIEDDATHAAVGRKIVVPGHAASGAGTGNNIQTMRSGGA